MAAPITLFRQHVMTIVQTEFAPEAIPVRSDKLHDSVGHDGSVAAVYPDAEAAGESGIHQNILVYVQVYGRYDLEIDPNQTVDPAKIEGWSWRLQRRIQQTPDLGQIDTNSQLWYFNVVAINYPDDPTGNKTRFIMALEGYSPLGSLVETVP